MTDIFSHVSSTPHHSGKKRKKRYEHDEDYDPNKSFTEYYDADLDDDTIFNETTAEYRYVFMTCGHHQYLCKLKNKEANNNRGNLLHIKHCSDDAEYFMIFSPRISVSNQMLIVNCVKS